MCYNIRVVDVLGLLLILGIGLVIGWVLLVGYTAWLLTHPPRRSYAWAVSRSLPGAPDELRIAGASPESAQARVAFESWNLRSRGRDLPVWEIAGRRRDGPVVIMSHGWGDSRTVMLASGRVEALLPLASKIVLWDMPGHGDAPGVCAMGEGEPADLAELVARVAGRGDAANPGLVLFGFSLGAAVTMKAVPRIAGIVRGIVLEAPYVAPVVPARNVLRLRGMPWRSNLAPGMMLARLLHRCGGPLWPWRRLERPPFPWLIEAVIDRPVLIVHGVSDAVSPVEGARLIASVLPKVTLAELAGGEHTTLWTDPRTRDQTIAAVTGFIASL